MALFQAPAVASRRTYPSTAYQAGQVVSAVFAATLTANFTAATDILEIGLLPAGAQLLSAELITATLATSNTATLSVMDGDYGDNDATRAAATDIEAGVVATAAESKLDTSSCLALAPANTHRSLGLEMSQDITGGATKTVQLVITYCF